MAEKADAQQPLLVAPTEKQPVKIASLLESVPLQYRQEFGSGNLVIGNGIEIKGEGEERKLHVVIYPQDPEYKKYKSSAAEFTEQRMGWSKARIGELTTEFVQAVQKGFLQGRTNELPQDMDPYQSPYAEGAGELEKLIQQYINNEIRAISQTSMDQTLDIINLRKQQLQKLSAFAKTARIIMQKLDALVAEDKILEDKGLPAISNEGKRVKQDLKRWTALRDFSDALFFNDFLNVTVEESAK